MNQDIKTMLNHIKDDAVRLYKEPILITLLIVTFLASGITIAIQALLLWMVFIFGWYFIKEILFKGKGNKSDDDPVEHEDIKPDNKD